MPKKQAAAYDFFEPHTRAKTEASSPAVAPRTDRDTDGDAAENVLRRFLTKEKEEIPQEELPHRTPLLFEIFRSEDVAVLLRAICGLPEDDGPVDLPRTVELLSRLRLPKRLPRRDRRSLRPRILIIRDTNIAMQPFQKDISQLVQDAQKLMGADDSVNVKEYDGRGSILELVRSFEGVSTVLVVSDLHQFAVATGSRVTSSRQWRQLAEASARDNFKVTILSPGMLAADGETTLVAEPAHRHVFENHPALLPIVPWFETSNPRMLREFAMGLSRPHFISTSVPRTGRALKSRIRPIGTSRLVGLGDRRTIGFWRGRDSGTDGSTGLGGTDCRELDLAALLTLSSDFDLATLRTLRLCLSDPDRVIQGYRLDRDSALPDLTPDRECSKAGPLTELLVWTAPLFATRRLPARYSGLHAWLRDRIPPARDTYWQPRYRIARQLIRRVRAHRSDVTRISDRLQWMEFIGDWDAADPPEAVRAALCTIEAETSSPPVSGSPLPNGEATQGDYLGVIPKQDRVSFGLNLRSPVLRFALPVGLDKSSIRIELLDKDGDPVESTNEAGETGTSFLLDAAQIELAWNGASLCAIRLGNSQTRYVSRPHRGTGARPIFERRNVTLGVGILFEGDTLIVDEEVWSVETLRPVVDDDGDSVSGEAAKDEDEVRTSALKTAKVELPTEDFKSRLAGRAAIPGAEAGIHKDFSLVGQRDPGSSRLSALMLPLKINDSSPTVVMGPGGAACLGFQESVVVQDHDDGSRNVTVVEWHVGDAHHRRPFEIGGDGIDDIAAAASSAGVVAVRQGSAKRRDVAAAEDLIWLEAGPGQGGRAPRLIQVPLDQAEGINRVAFSANGLVAVHTGHRRLRIYEPPWQMKAGLPDQDASAASSFDGEGGLPTVTTRKVRFHERSWIPMDGFEEAELADCLRSPDPGRFLRLCILHRIASDAISTERLSEAMPGAPDGLVPVLAAIWNRDDETAMATLSGPAGDRLGRWRDVDSGIALLHLAALRGVGAVFATLISRLGSDPRDKHGVTPILLAAASGDGGKSLSALHDHGADLCVRANLDGYPEGVLPHLLMSGHYGERTGEDLIWKVLNAGAPLDLRTYSAQRTVAMTAAFYGDPQIFAHILQGLTDPAREIAELDDSGWSALSMAAYSNSVEIAETCLKHIGVVSPAGSIIAPLEVAAAKLAPEILDLLLKRLAADNGGRLPIHPDLDVLRRGISFAYFGQASSDEAIAALDEEKKAQIEQARFNVLRVATEHGVVLDEAPWPLVGAFSTDRSGGADTSALIRDTLRIRGKNRLRIIHTALEMQMTHWFRTSAIVADETLSAVVDPLQTSLDGLTLAHIYAAQWDADADMGKGPSPFERLQAANLDIAAQDKNGYTALHVAARAGNLGAASALLDLDPTLTSIASADGVLPADLVGHGEREANAELAELVADAQVSLPAPVSPDPEALEPEETIGLSLMPADTVWEPLYRPLPRRRVASEEGHPAAFNPDALPFPRSPGFWTPLMQRWTELPYRDPVRLVETWWRRSDGTLGMCGHCEDDDENLICRLNGTSPPIHSMNAERIPAFHLDRAVQDYLHFFCSAIRGDHGNFALMYSNTKRHRLGLESRPGSRPDIPEVKTIDPRDDSDGDADQRRFRAKSLLLYSGMVFKAEFEIQQNGMVQMIEDDPVKDWTVDTASCIDGGIMYRKAV